MSVATPEVPPKPALSRKEMIAERQRRSPVWRVIHWLGSLNFALFLLASIALACAAATIAESNFNTKIAHAYFYKNPLFLIWLMALCVNLFAVTLTRWPWQKKHIGFVVTHYGIITLLIGAMIGMQTGFEGNVTLHKDSPPVSRITSSRSVIQIDSPADRSQYLMGFDAESARPSAGRPREFPVPGTKLTIVADDFSSNLVREQKIAESSAPEAGPALLVKFSSRMAGQTLDIPFVLAGGQPAEEDFFGLAKIAFRTALPEAAPPQAQETQMVFAKYAPVIQSGSAPSGVTVRLSEDGSKVSILSSEGVGATYLRSEIVGQPVFEAGVSVTVEKYWPDFFMENGRPATRSEKPDNPAVLVRIAKVSPSAETKPSLEMAPVEAMSPSPEGSRGDGDIASTEIAYQLRRGGQVYASGKAGPGESFHLGWADWQAEIIQFLPRGGVVSEVKPGPALEKGIPGFRAHLVSPDGRRGPDRWIESGQLTSLTDGTNVVRVGYGLETKPLPFSLRLVNFEVPRDEGTDEPADFRATVEFRDAKTGETKTSVARMNHPASFPGTLQANLTGINYKFSQAEWNPRDLEETTLQVLYDPGWLLKWIGSLGIVVGIAIMFYWKPGSA